MNRYEIEGLNGEVDVVITYPMDPPGADVLKSRYVAGELEVEEYEEALDRLAATEPEDFKTT